MSYYGTKHIVAADTIEPLIPSTLSRRVVLLSESEFLNRRCMAFSGSLPHQAQATDTAFLREPTRIVSNPVKKPAYKRDKESWGSR